MLSRIVTMRQMSRFAQRAATTSLGPNQRLWLAQDINTGEESSRLSNRWSIISIHNARHYGTQSPPAPIEEILEREIKDEMAELSRNIASDQFPGFDVEATDADVKLTKQCGNASVTVRFTVSSSLTELPVEEESKDPASQEPPPSQLVCMPDFQVQINKANSTLEVSCYFEEMEPDEETGEQYATEPVFGIDELVLYHGEPKETEYAVSAEYFQDDLQEGLMQFLANHGINEEFARNLVTFATSYEKKQYIGLMQRLKNFVTK